MCLIRSSENTRTQDINVFSTHTHISQVNNIYPDFDEIRHLGLKRAP